MALQYYRRKTSGSVVISIHRHWRLEAFRGIWKIVFALRRRGYHKHSRISYIILNVVGTLHVGSTIKSLNFEMGLALVAVTPKSSFSISDDYDDSSRLSTGSSSFSACVCSLQLVFQSPSLLFSSPSTLSPTPSFPSIHALYSTRTNSHN
jgi:hypothetical protein